MITLKKNEKTVFHALTHTEETVAFLVHQTSLPRMTVHTNLLRLQKYGLAENTKVIGKQKRRWKRAPAHVIEGYLKDFEDSLLDHRDVHRMRLSNTSTAFTIYRGKDNITKMLFSMLDSHKGQRICVFQTARNLNTWVKILGKKVFNELNTQVIRNNMVYVGLRTPNLPDWFYKDEDTKDSYKGRVQGTRFIPEEYFEPDTALYIVADQALLVNLKHMTALEINDRQMASIFIKMFTYMHEHAS